MKKSILIILFCGSLLFTGHSTLAQDNKFGIGAMVNSPTGISAKAWVGTNLAVDGALSFTIAENISQIYFHSDVLKHGYAISHSQMRNYYGLGMRLIWSDIGNDLRAGLRGPIGMAYTIEDTNIESFFEIAPTLDFAPDARFFFGGAVGMRIYLN